MATSFSQTIEKNQSNEKYETTIEKKYNEKSKQFLFSEISEWLATYYSSKVNSLKFTDLTKGKIIFDASFETHIFPAKGRISYTMTFLITDNSFSCKITDFVYASAIKNSLYRDPGIEMAFESRGMGFKKKIISTTEDNLSKAFENLESIIKK